MNQLIIQQASFQLGVKEIAGDQDNQTIVAYAHDIGLKGINDDETPWCAIFVYWVLKKCGLPYSGDARALSFLNYGLAVDKPEPGDIVVFSREGGKGHVAFFLGYSSDRNSLFVLGGNQGNSVSIATYNQSNLLGFRRASEEVSLEIPTMTMKQGFIGVPVKHLQSILLYLGLYTKRIDGQWGEGTTSAVIAFQTKHGLPTNGVYDKAMQDKLFTILNA